MREFMRLWIRGVALMSVSMLFSWVVVVLPTVYVYSHWGSLWSVMWILCESSVLGAIAYSIVERLTSR